MEGEGRVMGVNEGDGKRLPTLDEVSLAYVAWVLERCDGDKKRAAEALGVSLKTVYSKLARLHEIGLESVASRVGVFGGD